MKNVNQLVADYERWSTLDRAFYLDPDLFALEWDRILSRQWILLGPTALISEPGDYFLVDYGGESLIVIRDKQGDVHCLSNVCRHRGSRLLDQGAGSCPGLLSCPYHGWSYRPDGSLHGAPGLPKPVERSELGLTAYAVRIVEGLIFACLSSTPPDFEPVGEQLGRFFRPYDLEGTKVVARRTYGVEANWKLAIENYLECAHCRIGHPDFCRSHMVIGRTLDEKQKQRLRDWKADCAAHDWMTDDVWCFGLDCAPGDQYYSVSREPLPEGVSTSSRNGEPVAPLLGALERFEGGYTYADVGPFSYITAYSDHAMLMRFAPIAADYCELEITWLVRADAREGVDFDVDDVVYVWDVTSREDKVLIERNAAGIGSPSYRPGRYLPAENLVRGFVEWYLDQLVPGTRKRFESDCELSYMT